MFSEHVSLQVDLLLGAVRAELTLELRLLAALEALMFHKFVFVLVAAMAGGAAELLQQSV